MAQLPNFSGVRDMVFSMAEDRNEAIVAPAPGSTPMKKPAPDPLSQGPTERRHSSRVIQIEPVLISLGVALCRRFPRPNSTSLMAKRPMAATTTSIPSNSRSEEHTSELQSLMRTSYAVFCLKKKKQ